ncbi:hypothetical protein CERSUDRAFT_115398 [Gelatoporia subvermispora B]|uniref:Uncharacterized protein n=1 Tax=Ceriporiopsis subvermispora (strain B) TaxID=914234 RepID=M2RC82_CERS8|nr:hypothetical protein CERSUDRAFT_115398 [Gelatoporia subvermispora B]
MNAIAKTLPTRPLHQLLHYDIGSRSFTGQSPRPIAYLHARLCVQDTSQYINNCESAAYSAFAPIGLLCQCLSVYCSLAAPFTRRCFSHCHCRTFTVRPCIHYIMIYQHYYEGAAYSAAGRHRLATVPLVAGPVLAVTIASRLVWRRISFHDISCIIACVGGDLLGPAHCAVASPVVCRSSAARQ